mmetsp:Transcript_65902/g.190940  ORF Transcript_65902/g.190940 Transcript_65902/m.190940 type:complete len:263 (-) Transcript_65902:551-1339(-)
MCEWLRQVVGALLRREPHGQEHLIVQVQLRGMVLAAEAREHVVRAWPRRMCGVFLRRDPHGQELLRMLFQLRRVLLQLLGHGLHHLAGQVLYCVPDLAHRQLDECQHCPLVLCPELVQGLAKFLVGNVPRAVSVKHLDHGFELLPSYVHHLKDHTEFCDLSIGAEDLVEAEGAVPIAVHALAKLAELGHLLGFVLLLLLHPLGNVQLSRLSCPLDDHREDQVRETEGNREEGGNEENPGEWSALYEGDGDGAPTVPCYDGLK